MAKVSILRCNEYINDVIKAKMLQGLIDIGFEVNDFKNKKVLLKPNLLTAAPPEKAVVTHPEFFHSAVKLVKENGGIPVLAESPAVLSLNKVISKTGYQEIIDKEEVEVANVRETAVIVVDKPLKFKRFEVSKIFTEVDIIINLPKLKTHSLTFLTGAVKNFLGVIPGLNKSQWHVKAPSSEEFSELLLDLNEAIYSGMKKPVKFLHIMDAIIGMEGEGPGPSGIPRRIGAILISDDPIALDLTAANLIGLDYQNVRTIASGFKRPFGISSPGDVELVGEKLENIKVHDFNFPKKKNMWANLMRGPILKKGFKNLFTEKPVPYEKKCTLCYQCKNICPAGAISNNQGKKKVPVYDYDKCIRCFCCMEICPEAAIKLKKGKLQRLAGL